MALELTLDYALPIVLEPGYYKTVPTRDVAETAEPQDDNSSKELWRDDATRTVMLMPRQLQPDFLNTEQAAPSIIRLAQMQVYSGNLSANKIFEAPVGNNSNPFIWHEPAGPSSFFPTAPNPFPGSPPSLTSVPVPYDSLPSILAPPSQFRDTIYEVPATVPVSGSEPAPVVIGNTSDGKWLFHSADRLEANQGLFIRWFCPDTQSGYPLTYIFCIGQYCLRIKNQQAEIFRDVSANGDRSAWQKVKNASLWSNRHGFWGNSGFGLGTRIGMLAHGVDINRQKSLLWLPYYRNRVYLQSETGQWDSIVTRPEPVRLPDDSDWDITRSDTLAVWVLTPSPGIIQFQKLAYTTLHVGMNLRPVTLEYTPQLGNEPTATITRDADHGCTLTGAVPDPPGYTLAKDDDDDCPTPTTNSSDQSHTYGVTLSFHSGDGRHTPMLYNVALESPLVLGSRTTTPLTISDTADATYRITEATITSGLKEGQGRMHVDVVDDTPYSLSSYYYRTGIPVQLQLDGTNVFTGWTEPNEIEPLKEANTPGKVRFSALDRWKQLTHTIIPDQRDWTDVGHIDVVKLILELCGIDATSLDSPPINATYNTPLSLEHNTLDTKNRNKKAGWQPNYNEDAATFLRRIADNFSGWYIGFYPDGNPFYFPREWYTSSEVTFRSSNATGSGPLLRSPVVFRTVEPEANVIRVAGGDLKRGQAILSQAWVDWASIYNKNVVNYLGRRKIEIPELPGTYTCQQLNWIARVIWQQTRRRKILAEFEADFVPTLKVGHCCTVGSYSGVYRIENIQAHFVHKNWQPARYTALKVEKGFGLP